MPSRPDTPSSERPITFRQIARLAGVSQMTVSRAMSNRPRIAPDTRDRILRVARQLGYRPDPQISKLMHYLRRGVRPRFQGVICGLTNWPRGPKPPYFQALLNGLESQATRRGYGFEVMTFDASPRRSISLQRMLRGRGVQGVVLLPQSAPLDLGALLDWRELSAVAASMSVVGPEVNRVAPHHFTNTLRLCRELTALGYRRIGLVIEGGHDARVNHGFSAAVMSHARQESGVTVPPLVYAGSMRDVLEPWFKRERPDVIIETSEPGVRECARVLRLKIPGPVAFASTNLDARESAEPLIGGIDEVPREIGAIAADLLTHMIERSVRGLPSVPTSTLVAGQWRAGRSCPKR